MRLPLLEPQHVIFTSQCSVWPIRRSVPGVLGSQVNTTSSWMSMALRNSSSISVSCKTEEKDHWNCTDTCVHVVQLLRLTVCVYVLLLSLLSIADFFFHFISFLLTCMLYCAIRIFSMFMYMYVYDTIIKLAQCISCVSHVSLMCFSCACHVTRV